MASELSCDKQYQYQNLPVQVNCDVFFRNMWWVWKMQLYPNTIIKIFYIDDARNIDSCGMFVSSKSYICSIFVIALI